jgi:hypothetical protein
MRVDDLVIKKINGKYYLDKENLAQAKVQLSSKNKKLALSFVDNYSKY